MDWYVWLLIGAAIGIAGLFATFGLLNYIDDRINRRRINIMCRRSAAESKMQDVVQKTISDMFAASRWPR